MEYRQFVESVMLAVKFGIPAIAVIVSLLFIASLSKTSKIR